MSRLLSTELKKLAKSRTFIVCCILALLLGAGLTVVYYIVFINVGETLQMAEEFMKNMGMSEETIADSIAVVPDSNMWSYVNTCLADTNVLYLVSIVVCTFAASEFGMGTYKLSISRGYSRMSVFFSKLILSCAACIGVVFCYVLGGGIVSAVLFGFGSEIGAGRILLELAAYFVLFAAVASMFVMVSMITKKTGSAIALAIIIPIFIESGLMILSIAYKELSTVSRFWIFNTFTLTDRLCGSGDAYIPFVVAAAYHGASIAVGAAIFRKTDLK